METGMQGKTKAATGDMACTNAPVSASGSMDGAAAVLHEADSIPDQQLVERIAEGDRRALGVLYARHSTRVYRFVLRLVQNPANAEDLVSEIFLDVWKTAARFEGRAQVSTWLLSVARHKALSALRRRTHEQLDDATAANIPDGADSADVMLQKQHQAKVLRECLTELSPAHREIVDLVYYHGRSIAEVVEITGVPVNTVKTRMFYARKRLAELIDARGLDAAA